MNVFQSIPATIDAMGAGEAVRIVGGILVVLGLWRARVALDHSLFVVNAALIWVLMALFARFVADELPLWLKGTVFIGAGAAFFILNLRLARRPQAVATTPGEKS